MSKKEKEKKRGAQKGVSVRKATWRKATERKGEAGKRNRFSITFELWKKRVKMRRKE